MTIVDEAMNGLDAVNKVKKSIERFGRCTYDIILMDCSMPFMDGQQATKIIRQLLHSKSGLNIQ
jgi:CheY-like chemotaxis protein